MTNRLAESGSAYLRSAEHQPIEWYEYGEEAFQKAKELDRPVLLDIGAVWCHWCHVIDRESYENPEIAQLINDHYIAVKVDRDQRPDIDARYQQVVVSMSGQGGWPLTAFLTYDGRVIYGGTYFPPQTMKSLLVKIRGIYDEKKDEILAPEEILTPDNAQVREAAKDFGVTTQDQPPVAEAFCEKILQSMRHRYDAVFGGFGTHPKFPHFSGLELLITALYHNPHDSDLAMLMKTLDAMAHGGIYDQIAGGFHRYSVDRQWHVPHFEKMAYDNAEALKVYSQAYRLTGKLLYQEVTEGILDWVMRDLSDPEKGGFYASQDADIDLNDDGDHFTWTLGEVKDLLSAQEYEVVTRYYDMTPAGDMHERPGRNVLRVKWPETGSAEEALSNQLGIPLRDVQALLALGKAKLREARKNRPIPFIDTTLYANWNGMMIAGFLQASELLTHPEARAFALKSLDRMLSEFYTPGVCVYHATGIPGFLEDYGYLAQASLYGYYSTGEARYLNAGRDMVDILLRAFEDPQGGGFYDIGDVKDNRPGNHGLLQFRRKPVEDSPSSSANALAAQVLIDLYLLSGEDHYREKAERTIRAFAAEMEGYGFFVSALGLAAYRLLHPPLKLDIVGNSPALLEKAHSLYFPGKVLGYSQRTETEAPPQLRPCFAQRCLAPVSEGEDLETMIRSAASQVS